MKSKNSLSLVIAILTLFVTGCVCCSDNPPKVTNERQESNPQSSSGDDVVTQTSNTTGSATPATTASATPTVFPASLSPSENLELGKKALNDGDQRAAWAHLIAIKKGAEEFASAKQLLASIGEREQIEFELEQLNEREANVKRMASGLAYEVGPAELQKKLDNLDRILDEIYDRRGELNEKLTRLRLQHLRDAIQSPEVEARITKGEQLYKRIASRTGLPVMFGWRAQKMSLLIPSSDWIKLTKNDQIDLSYYAEYLVGEIRIDPSAYARKWAVYYKRTEQLERGGEYDGLDQSSYIEQVGNLCPTCWDITIGTKKRDGFYDESVPVTGANVNEFRASTS